MIYDTAMVLMSDCDSLSNSSSMERSDMKAKSTQVGLSSLVQFFINDTNLKNIRDTNKYFHIQYNENLRIYMQKPLNTEFKTVKCGYLGVKGTSKLWL